MHRKIELLSVAVALVVLLWTVDATLDSLIFRERTIWEFLFPDTFSSHFWERMIEGVLTVTTLLVAFFYARQRHERDIVIQNRLLEQLQESTKHYRALVDLYPDLIFIHNGETIRFINVSGARLLGANNPDEVVGKLVRIVISPEDLAEVDQRINQVIRQRVSLPFCERTYVRLDGTRFDVEVAATPFDYEGRPAALVMARDISQRKQLLKDLEQTTLETITMLAKAIDEKDSYTAGHCQRLAEMCARLGQELHLNKRRIEQLRCAALLHDVGKVAVPDAILNKPAKLTPDEWKQIKTHPTVGAMLVRSVHALEPAAHIVAQHHERWDGKGYPQGLAGEDISLEARILSVVDSYDAMTTDRPYRRALPRATAFEELRKCSTTQFDPSVVEAFVIFAKQNRAAVTAS